MNKVKDAADKVKSSTDQMSTSAKKANDEVTKFDRSAQKTQKSLLSWAKEKYSVLLEAKDKISPILSTIKGGLTSFGRKTWSVTMKAVDLATAPIRGVINLLKNPILQVGAVLGVSIGLKDTIDTYKDFEAAMSQVKAVSGATGSEFDKLTAKAKEMGATTKFTATQSAEAFNYMAMAGWDSQQMLDGIEGILNLAAASGEDLGTTSDIVTDALTAFGLKIKYGNGASLDIDSFNQLQEELQAQVSSFKETYDNALTVTLTNLNLQLSEGAITQEQYDAAVQQATDGYYANINDMEVRVSSFNLDTIAEAWNDELTGIMPDMEGSVSEKLNAALQTALSEKPDISSWTQEDMMGWLGLDDMTIDTSAFENIYQELVATAENMAPTAKEEIVQSLKESIPTMEEVMAEYGPISNEAYESIVEQYKEAMNSSFESADFSSIGTTLSTKMSDSILNTDTSAFSTAFAELGTKSGTDAATAFQAADYSGVGAAVGSGISSAITNADMAQINSAVDALKSNTDSSVNSAFGAGVSTTMPVSVTLDYSLVNPTKTFTIGGGGSGSTTLTVSAHASGGYVNDKQLSWVGEEGPEAIIPLVPGRRNRALELYKEVGDILGVQANANGNIIGEATPLGGGSGSTTIGSTATEMFAYSSISDFLSLNDNLLAEAIRNGATGYNGFTEGTESDSDTADEPLSSSSTVETGKTNINLNIQMSPQFNISDSGTGKMDEASIMAIIRKNMKSMADELGGEIADRLEQVFSNMPVVKEG